LSEVWIIARTRLRTARRRSLATAAGIFAASALLGVAVTVGYGLDTGFERAAQRADLPDIVARFDGHSRADVDRRVRALPGIEARSYRFEVTGASLRSAGGHTDKGAVDVVGAGRRGYAVVEGTDVRGAGADVVVERGLANAWHLRVGDSVRIGRLGGFRVVGIAVEPFNVAFPLASAAHVWLTERYFDERFGPDRVPGANVALVWLRDRGQTATALQQARASSAGITGLRFLTRDGVRVLLSDAAGVVVALLGAVSLVGLIAAGIMLATGAQADVQRRLAAIGVQRAIGFRAGAVAAGWALAGVVVSLPAGAAGLATGAALAYGPTTGLLEALNELPPGRALLWPLALALVFVVVLVGAATAVPARRAAGRPPVALLRGAELGGARRLRGLPSAPAALGVRLVAARRARALTTVAVLAVTGGVLLLMLALGSLLADLRDDPGTLGRRYELSVPLDPDRAGEVARVPGVAAAAPRYAVEAADSFSLGEPVRVIAYPGDHTPFEAPPLASGKRVSDARGAEVGRGLADSLGLHVGGTLALQLPGGREVRFRVRGIVRALEHDGRVAYVRSARLLRAEPDAPSVVAVRLDDGADRGAVRREIVRRTGASARVPGASTPRDRGFLGTLATLVRVLAGAIAAVCLYALVQALAIVARERRSTLAMLRATGAGTATVAGVLAGAALAVALPAAAAAWALELVVLGPAVSGIAAGYADLSLAPTAGQVALLAAGFAALAGLAAAWVARGAVRETIVTGLRRE
jgi:putative ABC transport system permease protein